MKVNLYQQKNSNWELSNGSNLLDESKVQLVLSFASKSILSNANSYSLLQEKFPNAQIAMCSTAGEILGVTVSDESFIAVAFEFSKTPIQTTCINVLNYTDSYAAGKALIEQLPQANLSYVLVFSDGSKVNGSDLVKGLNEAVNNKILITGGLAGDAAHFKSTLVGLNEQPASGNIVAIGFYDKHIQITHGSEGGWETFGPERIITKASQNKLFEIDNRNALDLYKKYLGSDVLYLPASALLFPLSVTIPNYTKPLVRTILSIDEEEKSMTFAGNMPEGSTVRLMKGNFDKLSLAASTAASNALQKNATSPPFALLISCVGRKLILKHRVEEEVETVQDLLGAQTLLAGFYSYGEIAPFNGEINCQLHNQTMTITTFNEL